MGRENVQDKLHAGYASTVNGPEARGDNVCHTRRNELQKRVWAILEDD
jgi:hypothetical protein